MAIPAMAAMAIVVIAQRGNPLFTGGADSLGVGTSLGDTVDSLGVGVGAIVVGLDVAVDLGVVSGLFGVVFCVHCAVNVISAWGIVNV